MRDTGSVDLKDPARIIERSVEVQDNVYPEVKVNPKVHPESNLRSRHSRRHHSTITMQTHRQTDRDATINQTQQCHLTWIYLTISIGMGAKLTVPNSTSVSKATLSGTVTKR